MDFLPFPRTPLCHVTPTQLHNSTDSSPDIVAWQKYNGWMTWTNGGYFCQTMTPDERTLRPTHSSVLISQELEFNRLLYYCAYVNRNSKPWPSFAHHWPRLYSINHSVSQSLTLRPGFLYMRFRKIVGAFQSFVDNRRYTFSWTWAGYIVIKTEPATMEWWLRESPFPLSLFTLGVIHPPNRGYLMKTITRNIISLLWWQYLKSPKSMVSLLALLLVHRYRKAPCPLVMWWRASSVVLLHHSVGRVFIPNAITHSFAWAATTNNTAIQS